MKFMRRADLTIESRMEIGFRAYLNQGVYGAITRISSFYGVSRTFIYQQLAILNLFITLQFTELAAPTVPLYGNDDLLDRLILLLRLEGRCSLHQISNILLGLGLPTTSVGMISERLACVSRKLSANLCSDTVQLVVFVSDELFVRNQPILVTIDPRSTAILGIELASDRSGERWKGHWEEIERNQYYMMGLVSDEGTGMAKGFKDLDNGCPHISDLFHGIRDLSQSILVRLQEKAYAAIEAEYDRWRVLDSARSERVINKRIDAYETAAATARQAIDHYDRAEAIFR